MDLMVGQLLESPKLVMYYQFLKNHWDKEQQQRQGFYKVIMVNNSNSEFINGQTIHHNLYHSKHDISKQRLSLLLNTYLVHVNALGKANLKNPLVSLSRNDYKPDICYFTNVKADLFRPNQMRFPAPDLVVEIVSPSTEKNDRGIKFEDYAAHGVEEYWIIDPKDEFVEQYALKGGEYELLIKADNGTLRSVVIAGFTIPIRAIFDEAINLTALQTLLAGH